ncbi:CheR family methyltransferase [Aureibacter tunicatorum]|uniref:Chemotaxis protein methyltransferase CheR n=1 Tax=Aureibacter tunicatorum TaxID=866807 RepID=A0AAE3XLD9_9BACT|nr:protein-glutamate O-methyltransferase CheR [Aureibacter tunicatorum]MDR6239027.1 chemotaxis protein methyltransferase CheR [Aureibacter tunicatorum]BDD05047.1 chemotaxis protein R [Aureibacter tunicatorum]
MQEIEISDIKALAELVHKKYNVDFTNYAMSSFRRRVTRVIDLYRFESVKQLIERVDGDKVFFETFLSEITVNVTEMFRDPSFWRFIREHVIPNILINHKSINIWHAGCSSGEEVFSMAILLEEMNLLDKVRIYATDLDKAILDRAKKGIYSKKKMELNNKNYIRFQGERTLEEYYTLASHNEVKMNSSLLRNVTFKSHDLVKGDQFNKFDLVLCRNVMIYFNQTLQNQVIKSLHKSLFKYGYLAIGSKESLIWCDISNKFIVVNNEEKIFKKIRE